MLYSNSEHETYLERAFRQNSLKGTSSSASFLSGKNSSNGPATIQYKYVDIFYDSSNS